MSNLVHKGNVIPKKEITKAILSWMAVGVPSLIIQDADDGDKAFTVRFPVKTSID